MLRDVAFLRLWAAMTASGLAAWALPFALGLAVLDRSLSPTALGVVLATRTGGFLIAVPVAGVLADRYSRRGVVCWAGLSAAAASLLIAVGVGRSVLLMAGAAAVFGAGHGASRPAFQALIADVVPPARRQEANAAITLAVRGTVLVAPGLVVLLAAVVDLRMLIGGIGLLWLVAGVLPPLGVSTHPRQPGRASFVAEFTEGLREARRHPWFLAGLAALSVVIFAGYSATSVALPLVSRDRYDSEIVLAAALTGYTAGAIAGALLIARWRPRNQGWAALAGLGCYGLAPLSLAFPVHPVVVVAAYVIVGVALLLFNVPWFTATQREVAPEALARVSSLDFLISYGLAPVGLALIAPAIEVFGVQPVLVCCALACFLTPAAAAVTPSSRHFAVDRRGAPARP